MCQVQPVQADFAHLGLARFDVTREKLHRARLAAREHGAKDLAVLEIRVDDALRMGKVEAPHDADALGDGLVDAREFGVARVFDQRGMEILVEAGDARAVGEAAPGRHEPHFLQATERRLGEFFRRKTLMFNGYADQVAGMYSGMDLRKNY